MGFFKGSFEFVFDQVVGFSSFASLVHSISKPSRNFYVTIGSILIRNCTALINSTVGTSK